MAETECWAHRHIGRKWMCDLIKTMQNSMNQQGAMRMNVKSSCGTEEAVCVCVCGPGTRAMGTRQAPRLCSPAS